MNPSPSESTSRPWTRAARFMAAAALVIALALSAVWPSREGQFLSGDDERLILNHILVNHPSPGNAGTLLTHLTDDLYQPLPMISFQIDYAGANPDPAGRFPIESAPFHRTNMWLHTINSILVLVLVRRWAGCSRIALMTALLFACHPFVVEPVAWINGRMILMMSLFALLAMWAMAGRRNGVGGEIGGVTAYLLSVLSKVHPTIPFAAAWVDWRVNGWWNRRRAIAYVAMLALAVGGGALAVLSVSRSIPADQVTGTSGASLPTRGLLAASYYLQQYFYPSRLAAWSPPAKEIGWRSGPCLIAILEVLAFVAAIGFARRRERTVFLGLGLFALLLLPFLVAAATRRFLAADRYMYLPILGLHLAFAACAIRLLDHLRGVIGEKPARLGVGLSVLGVLIACVWWSGRLSETWQDSVQRDRRIVEVYPDEADAWAQLAKAEIFCGHPDAALQVIADARRRWPDHARLAAAAGDAYRAKGDWIAAERELAVAAEKLPGHLRTQYEYALTLESLGRPALERYEKILELDPTYLPAITAIARIHQAAGRIPDAISFCERALKINPSNVETLRRLAGLRMSQSEDAKALELLERAAQVDPTDLTAMVWLHILLAETGRERDAATWWERAAVAGLDTPETQSWRAWAYYSASRPADADRLIAQILNEPRAPATGQPPEQNRGPQRAEQNRDRQRAESSDPRDRQRSEPSDPRDHERADNTDPANFAIWAQAIEALRRGDEKPLAAMEVGGSFARPFQTLQTERRRAIIAGIGHLPDQRRTTPAALYLVSRAFLIDGQVEASRKIAQRIITTSGDNIWASAAKTLLAGLPATDAGGLH